MKLRDAIDQITQLRDEEVIFARRPWTLDTDAYIGMLDENLRVPDVLINEGLEYFLEVSVAKEVLEVFGNRNPTLEQVRELLVFYAENDAYPQWVYW
ncbi:DUF7716 domain-containing protein [Methylomicrobium agile]|uniref:DUF7716 domain-containing protein n=1 Tax=Methylomicrobium agile TaxID=39774 RepID=UPI0004DFA91E|nr:hypothetical protein [Methylomicrobium agile]